MSPKEDDCIVCEAIPPLDRPLFRLNLFKIPLQPDEICGACLRAFGRNIGLPVMDDEDDDEQTDPGGVTVRSKFVMVEYRRESQRLFAGTYQHKLVQADGGIRIAFKRVDLVNCDAPMDGLVVPF